MHSSPGSATPRGTPSQRGKSPKFSGGSPTPSRVAGTANGTNKPATTFMSCLSIPVEGAVPVEPDTGVVLSASAISASQATAEPRRAARKSKTDALAALSGRNRSTSPGFEDFDPQSSSQSKVKDGSSVRINPKLDLSTVKTSSPRKVSLEHTAPRPFELQNCPEYFPTEEEFKDPMAYIKSISDEAKEYGICKIIPPEGWKMPFVTETETFRFKTRLQRLNSIEASSRAKLNFLEQLYRYHKQQGNPRVVVPTINHKPLDLWTLRKEVQRLGGYEAVSKGKKWSDLGRILGYGGIPGLSAQIKNSYIRVILPYEHFCERVRSSPTLSSLLARDPASKDPNYFPSTSGASKSVAAGDTDERKDPSSPLTSTSSPLSDVPEDGDNKDANGSPNGRPRRSTRSDERPSESPLKSPESAPTPVVPPPVFYDVRTREASKGTPEQTCEVCHKKNRGEEMLLCDGCDCGFHMFCLDPPLESIPNDQWFCYTCLAGTGGDFGFDDGEEHSLSSFQARDKEFKRLWFESHPPTHPDGEPMLPSAMVNQIGDVNVSEFDVEDEFWRLVQSQLDTVEIEYGADVHSTTHGSGMPTMETHPLDSYSKDPWNLNNLPIVSDSLLRYIKSDISGMTVPWTYVGMTFSTFCWHNEDHYTYSVNFMHWGEPKTWYGIPGADAEKFEQAIKYEAPELFETQPDLLFQLVTLMNPKRVKDAGVRICACNQRAGEFVITFPKAYHAGFNHGLNFNEAVNFALPDWLPLGLDCVKRYREHRKLPVFSHDELLITITQQSTSIKTAMWLSESLQEMVTREMAHREQARSIGISETLVEEDRPEEQYQCNVCKVFCYLSQITCDCSLRVVCVDHLDLLCDRPKDHLILRKRFSDNELLDIQRKIIERATSPSQWKSKLQKLLKESSRPSLRSLRALLAEGDRIGLPFPELHSLRKCVNRANEWVDSANSSFLVRKQSRNRSRKIGRPRGSNESDDVERAIPERSLADLYALLDEVKNLGFDCPEIASLQSLAQQAEDFKTRAQGLLDLPSSEHDREGFLQECKVTLLNAESINVQLDELFELLKIVDREKLLKELDQMDESESSWSLSEVRQFLSRARTCNLPMDHPHMKILEERNQEGNEWEDRANSLLARSDKTIEDLADFIQTEESSSMDSGVLDRLRSAHAQALEYDKQAEAWLAPENGAALPRVHEVLRYVQRVEKEFSIRSVEDLKKTADIATDLEIRCDQVMRNKYHAKEGENVFTIVEQWRSYAKEHLRMFQLPLFRRMERQLDLHQRWYKELPWFCPEHKLAHTGIVLKDVLRATAPQDDAPPTDEYMTCICEQPCRPPTPDTPSDAVQCDHCFARFHGSCAKTGGSCPFCDHNHWNGALHPGRNWHSYYFPGMLTGAPDITKYYCKDWKDLELMVHRLDRLATVIGSFLSFASQPGNQKPELLTQVRHYMRKLYKIHFAVSPSPDISFGLDLAGLHRILAHNPQPSRPRKRRRPRFIFGQDVDLNWTDGTRCICRGRTSYLLNYPTVECEGCRRMYHAGCVFFPISPNSTTTPRFICPLCCLRKPKSYPYSDVRVKPPHNSDASRDPDLYIDSRQMLDTFSKDVIYKRMAPPYTQTLFVEMVAFTPGSPETSVPVSPTTGRDLVPAPEPQGVHNGGVISGRAPAAHDPPPPPWSRWSNAPTPPGASRRGGPPPPPPFAERRSPDPPSRRTFEDERSSRFSPPISSRGMDVGSISSPAGDESRKRKHLSGMAMEDVNPGPSRVLADPYIPRPRPPSSGPGSGQGTVNPDSIYKKRRLDEGESPRSVQGSSASAYPRHYEDALETYDRLDMKRRRTMDDMGPQAASSSMERHRGHSVTSSPQSRRAAVGMGSPGASHPPAAASTSQQSLSPSLAKLMSPSNASPSSAYGGPSRNKHDSPVLPPMKILESGPPPSRPSGGLPPMRPGMDSPPALHQAPRASSLRNGEQILPSIKHVVGKP